MITIISLKPLFKGFIEKVLLSVTGESYMSKLFSNATQMFNKQIQFKYVNRVTKGNQRNIDPRFSGKFYKIIPSFRPFFPLINNPVVFLSKSVFIIFLFFA